MSKNNNFLLPYGNGHSRAIKELKASEIMICKNKLSEPPPSSGEKKPDLESCGQWSGGLRSGCKFLEGILK